MINDKTFQLMKCFQNLLIKWKLSINSAKVERIIKKIGILIKYKFVFIQRNLFGKINRQCSSSSSFSVSEKFGEYYNF